MIKQEIKLYKEPTYDYSYNNPSKPIKIEDQQKELDKALEKLKNHGLVVGSQVKTQYREFVIIRILNTLEEVRWWCKNEPCILETKGIVLDVLEAGKPVEHTTTFSLAEVGIND